MFETEHRCSNVWVCACSCLSVGVDLVSVWYPLCASSFDSQNAAWNMAASLAIMSWGKIIHLNSFDPAKIKRTEKVLESFIPQHWGDVKTKQRKLARLKLNFNLEHGNVLVEWIYGYFLKTSFVSSFCIVLFASFKALFHLMFMLRDSGRGWFFCTFIKLAAN